ncbi:Tn7 transposase TnsA N-terminal domain-containing protein [Fictibacillus nanhaiensis]|uniref:TnsA endonuclease N-terminal domain-containing protein n=1 Tax=Fictibacillus nanhaiensis TaxID=742169 RepID=UPI001C949DFF|nr:Tn7 transposase TnsA N-terminal domain-containing protein [Fictibacillus nanhaiensis]
MYTPILHKGRSHYGSNFWDGFSPKLNRDVNLYSNLEYDHWVLVETNFNIVEFCEQPHKVFGSFEGKEHSSIFDMWIKWKDGKEVFIEIKYRSDLQPECKQYKKNIRQITIQKDWCNKKKKIHRVLTEHEIRENSILLDNKKIILPHLRNVNKIGDAIRFKVIKEMRKEKMSLEELCLKVDDIPTHKLKQVVYILIYEERINSNIADKPLGLETEVWING